MTITSITSTPGIVRGMALMTSQTVSSSFRAGIETIMWRPAPRLGRLDVVLVTVVAKAGVRIDKGSGVPLPL